MTNYDQRPPKIIVVIFNIYMKFQRSSPYIVAEGGGFDWLMHLDAANERPLADQSDIAQPIH